MSEKPGKVYRMLMPPAGEGSSMIDMSPEEEQAGVDKLERLAAKLAKPGVATDEVVITLEDMVKLIVTLLKDKGDKRPEKDITADVQTWLSRKIRLTTK